MEVYVTRGTDTEVRAYEGEVESLTSADSSGVGIRVLVDAGDGGSQVGFAWAGSLDPRDRRRRWPTPATTPASPRPIPTWSWPSPTAWRRVALDLWDDGVWHRRPWRRRSPWPSTSSVRRAPPTPGSARCRRPTTATAGWRWRSPRRPASRRTRRRTNAFLSVDAIAGEGTDTQTGSGFSVGRGPGELVPDEAMDDAVRAGHPDARVRRRRARRTARSSSTPGSPPPSSP